MKEKVYVPGLIVLVSTISLASIVSAQTSWWRTYGGRSQDEGYSVQQTSDGGYVVAGESFGESYDLYLIKTDASGHTSWTKTYGGTDCDIGNSVQQTADGGYIITGFTWSFGPGTPGCENVYLIKTNVQGDTLWTRTYGGAHGDEGNLVQQTSDGGYVIAGLTQSFGPGTPTYTNIYLIKTDAQGDTLWTKTYGGPKDDLCSSVHQTTDGGYIITGAVSLGAGASDVYLIKTDAQGDTLWTKTYGGTGIDGGNSVQQTEDGGYIIAGYTEPFGAGQYDVYLVKTNTQGDALWTKTYGGPDWDKGTSVKQTTDGGYIVAGYTYSFGAGSGDVWVIKTNAQGDTFWTKTYGGTNDDGGYSVQQTADGGYIISGCTSSFGAGDYDVYLIKTDSLGNVGVGEESPGQQSIGRKPEPTVIRRPPKGAVAFDATGRRVLHPRSGIYFLRTTATVAPEKVLLVK